jgi:hypothetical protein
VANRQQHQRAARTSLATAIEGGKIELTAEAIEKVSGGHTPSNAIIFE